MPNRCSSKKYFQRQLTCLSLPSPSYTQKGCQVARSSIFFNGSLYVYYYHGPLTLLDVPVSVPSHVLFFCMSHYHDPVTRK
jgi:hypothetical protein